jgi:transcriptional regulator with XRE-family HTH domain
MRASEPYLSLPVNHASLKHGLLKKAYLARMGEKEESYVRDQKLFSGRVTVRMEELGLQATDLAEACGISVTAIGYILKGSTKYPRPETLFALADKLGVEPRWLGTGEGTRLAATTPHRDVLIRGREGQRSPGIPHKKIKSRTS